MEDAVTPFPMPESTPPVTTTILRFCSIVSLIRFWTVGERSAFSSVGLVSSLVSSLPPRRRAMASRVDERCSCRCVLRNDGGGIVVVLRRKDGDDCG